MFLNFLIMACFRYNFIFNWQSLWPTFGYVNHGLRLGFRNRNFMIIYIHVHNRLWFSIRLPINNARHWHSLMCVTFSSNVERRYVSFQLLSLSFILSSSVNHNSHVYMFCILLPEFYDSEKTHRILLTYFDTLYQVKGRLVAQLKLFAKITGKANLINVSNFYDSPEGTIIFSKRSHR